jgi:hypothetical protein
VTVDTEPAEMLTPYTVAPPMGLPHMTCSLGWETLPPGTAAFTDSSSFVVCARCAAHCVTCTDADCDHPTYVYASQEGQ